MNPVQFRSAMLGNPQAVLKNYEIAFVFLTGIGEHLDYQTQKSFWQIMESALPGYDLDRKVAGRILPDHVITGYPQDARYDDELLVNWG